MNSHPGHLSFMVRNDGSILWNVCNHIMLSVRDVTDSCNSAGTDIRGVKASLCDVNSEFHFKKISTSLHTKSYVSIITNLKKTTTTAICILVSYIWKSTIRHLHSSWWGVHILIWYAIFYLRPQTSVFGGEGRLFETHICNTEKWKSQTTFKRWRAVKAQLAVHTALYQLWASYGVSESPVCLPCSFISLLSVTYRYLLSPA